MLSSSEKNVGRPQPQIQDHQNKPVNLILKSENTDRQSREAAEQEKSKKSGKELVGQTSQKSDEDSPPEVNQKNQGKFSHLKLKKKGQESSRQEDTKQQESSSHLEAESGTRFNKFKIQIKNKGPEKNDVLANISYSDQELRDQPPPGKIRRNVTDSSPRPHKEESESSEENEKEQEKLEDLIKHHKKVNFNDIVNGKHPLKSGQESQQRSESEPEDEEEQNDIVPGFDNLRNHFDDSLINDLQKDSSFFSYKKDKGEDLMKNMRKVRDDGSSQGSQVKISPIEMIISQGRAFTPTIPFMRQTSDRAPTPTMNRPSFRTKMQFSSDARRAQTPAPNFDEQIQSRRNALEILNIQRANREEEQAQINEENSHDGTRELEQSVHPQQQLSTSQVNIQDTLIPVAPQIIQAPQNSANLAVSRLFLSLKIDLTILSFSFLILAAFFYLEIFHMYALILVPASEIILLLFGRAKRKSFNRVADKTTILKNRKAQPLEQDSSKLQLFLRWYRLISKLIMVISFIVLWIVGENLHLYLAIIPCVVSSLVSLLVEAIRFSKISYMSYHLLIFKFMRSIAYLQLMLIIKSNGILARFEFSQPRSQTWPVIIYFAIGIPANVILVCYSVFSRMAKLNKKNCTSEKSQMHALAFMLLLFTSVSVFLGLFVRYLDQPVTLVENLQVRRLCIASGIFYAMMTGVSLLLRTSLKSLFGESYQKEDKHRTVATSNTYPQNKIEPIVIIPPQAPNGSTTRVLINPTQRVAFINDTINVNDTINAHESSISPVTSNIQNTSRNNPLEVINQADQNQRDEKKSEFSFNYVEKQNSVMFHNVKKENLNNLSELEKSLAQSRQPQQDPNQRSNHQKNFVGHLDQSGADSMLNFSLTGKLMNTEDLRQKHSFGLTGSESFLRTGVAKSSQFKRAHQKDKKNTQIDQGVHSQTLEPQYRIYTPQVAGRMKRNQHFQQDRMDEIETELNLTKNAEKMFILSQIRENKRSQPSLEDANSKRYILRELRSDDEESLNGTSVLDKADQSKISKLDATQKRERYNSLFSENPFSGLQLQQGQIQSPITKKKERDTRSEIMESNLSRISKGKLEGMNKKSEIQMLIQTNQEQETSMLMENGVKLCHVCMEELPDAIFHPCGHGGLCFNCAQIIVETNANCHYCRKPLTCKPLEKVLKINLKKTHKNIYKVLEVFKVISQESIDGS